jgi:hypothetical protein
MTEIIKILEVFFYLNHHLIIRQLIINMMILNHYMNVNAIYQSLRYHYDLVLWALI